MAMQVGLAEGESRAVDRNWVVEGLVDQEKGLYTNRSLWNGFERGIIMMRLAC